MNNEQKMTAEQLLQKAIDQIRGVLPPYEAKQVESIFTEYAAQEAASTPSARMSKEQMKYIIQDYETWVAGKSRGTWSIPDAISDYLASLPSGSKGEVEQKEETKWRARPGKTELYGLMSDYSKIDGLSVPPLLKNWVVGFLDWFFRLPPNNQPSPAQEQPE